MSEETAEWAGPSGPGEGCLLGHLPGLGVFDIHCGVTDPGWSGTGNWLAYQVVLVRSGGFLFRRNGEESFVDSTCALVLCPGDDLGTAHPAGCDTYTVLQYAEPPDLDLRPGGSPVSDEVDLRHRALVSTCRSGLDAFELGDRVAQLTSALSARPPASAFSARPATVVAHRRLVDRTLEALVHEGYASGLDDLAYAVGASPHHLSRVFHGVTGMTLTAYRNRLRVRAVLEDMQEGAENLRTLAAAYGFADQSHLIRVVRRHLGRTPTELRRLLRA